MFGFRHKGNSEEPKPGESTILAKRGLEIRDFVQGKLSEDKRKKFVAELSDPKNLPLRKAVRLAREKFAADEVPVSDAANDLQNKITNAFRQAEGFFPGNSYIAGIENRSDIRPRREEWLNKAIENCDKLIERGELNRKQIKSSTKHSKWSCSSNMFWKFK